MANPHHLEQLARGTAAWNRWREENPDLRLDLSLAHLEGRDLSEANLAETFLRGTQLSNARLVKAAIRDADLSRAILTGADLTDATLNRSTLIETNLFAATLKGAVLDDANLRGANLSQVNLRGVSLCYTILADANLSGADLTGCSIYGVSVWNTRLDETIQKDLAITPSTDSAPFVQEPAITVPALSKCIHSVHSFLAHATHHFGRWTVHSPTQRDLQNDPSRRGGAELRSSVRGCDVIPGPYTCRDDQCAHRYCQWHSDRSFRCTFYRGDVRTSIDPRSATAHGGKSGTRCLPQFLPPDAPAPPL